MTRRRYHVEVGEPDPDTGEHEWNVCDRAQLHAHCEGCTGVAVATFTTRAAARAEAAALNATAHTFGRSGSSW